MPDPKDDLAGAEGGGIVGVGALHVTHDAAGARLPDEPRRVRGLAWSDEVLIVEQNVGDRVCRAVVSSCDEGFG